MSEDIYQSMKFYIEHDEVEAISSLLSLNDDESFYYYNCFPKMAFDKKSFKVAKFLLNHKKIIFTESDFAAGFYQSSCKSDLELVNLLINHKDLPENYDFTHGAIRAAKYGRIKLLKLYLNYKHLKLNIRNNSIIQEAAVNGHYSCVKALLEDDRIDPTDNYNKAIRSAFLNRKHKVVDLLSNDKRIQNSFTKESIGDVYKKDALIELAENIEKLKISNKINLF
jgi:ankyrin repeat protein